MEWNNVPEIKSTLQNIAYGLGFFICKHYEHRHKTNSIPHEYSGAINFSQKLRLIFYTY